MKFRPILLFLSCIFIAAGSNAAELAGVKLDDKIRVSPAGLELVLNGMGIRTRFVFKVYVGGLYLPEKKTNANDILSLPGAKRVSITLLRDITAQQFTESLAEGVRNNSSPAEQEALKARVDLLFGIMNALKEAKKGDVILLDDQPDSGVSLTVNGQPQGKPIPGDDFQRALLRIWLGDKPADPDLKKGMLGG